ncbi:ATP-binding protein [Rhodoferax saidenbachensis]|uniref:ATP-binding protein n=1 Tax=Rhodoferax saidenbachensis TaxID=1484693 RepID=UPI001F4C6086|nr:ATP-binding protein [Rhodoferax saidenbachensis]
MEQRATAELISLFQDAVKVGGAALEMRVRRFASLIRATDPELAQAAASCVGAGATRSLLSTMRTPPVDGDTKLPLVRVEPADTPRQEPLLGTIERTEIQRVIRERQATDRLMEAGYTPVRSVLMSGPPGVGKTMTAGWLAKQLDLPLVTLDLASVMSSYLGKTGANVRAVLNHAQTHPCVLLLDEFDSIAKRRDDDSDVGELKRLVTVILQTIDDWSPLSLLVAATNHGELLDPAVWRRFDVTLNFSLPGHAQRAQLLRAHGVGEELADGIGAVTEGQTFSVIFRAVESARKQTILEDKPFDEALAAWALSVTAKPAQSASQYERQRRDLQVLVHHGRQMSAREIAEVMDISHTTVIRSLNRFHRSVNVGT